MCSAQSAAWMAAFLGFAVSPNLLTAAADEMGHRQRVRPGRKIGREYDPEVAAQLRAEREQRKYRNYCKRYPNKSRSNKK